MRGQAGMWAGGQVGGRACLHGMWAEQQRVPHTVLSRYPTPYSAFQQVPHTVLSRCHSPY